MKIAVNSNCPETDDQLFDYEYWEELQRSGYRNISSREFAGRPSTRIDPEILKKINSDVFGLENKASTRPGHTHNVIQLHQLNSKRRNAPTPRDHAGTRMVIDSSVPHHIRVKLGRWNHANPQDRDSLGNTPLHRAVMKGEPPAVIEFLANKGIDVNALNKAQQTALFIATCDGRANLVKALLKMGACPKLRNSKGISPPKAASIKGHITTVNEPMGSGAKARARKSKKKRNTGRRPQHKDQRYTWEQD